MPQLFQRLAQGAASLACLLSMGAAMADADTSSHQAADPHARTALPGHIVYRQFCQACHMADGKGASGAGAYPALADNIKLTAAGYPIHVILNGQGAMPWFNGLLQDEEVANVVNYIRANFGNAFPDPASAADVAQMRGPAPVEQ